MTVQTDFATSQEPKIPEGWRKLKVGETVISGDYFNSKHNDPDNPKWMPYLRFVGNAYGGNMCGIRKENPNAPDLPCLIEVPRSTKEKETTKSGIITDFDSRSSTSNQDYSPADYYSDDMGAFNMGWIPKENIKSKISKYLKLCKEQN
jgi:hypothetical protein